ncbi:hypothetical protein FOA43_002098 [Brettanomyces nanus]|uniref:Conserved oligomeric Golgi complex subunit 2 n=1 Tax=Eeniella nana TaxID=13502 RepID=A0A875S6E7_EENNA|nr:uncharacterized protein FOA43_002098 [Brettanomyces nanus]QPG74764.1 hypothetical protein FOA43_002098 [Brettanomyces nanus]
MTIVDPSVILLQNYKYWSLDDLSDGLDQLLKEVDGDLVDLVNSNYLRFIDLGKSLDGSLDMTHDIKIDVANYIRRVKGANRQIDIDSKDIVEAVKYKRRLCILKRVTNIALLVDEQMETFIRINKRDEDDQLPLNHLTALYFSINKQYAEILKMINTGELITTLSRKMSSLQMEFRSLVGDELKIEREKDDKERMFELIKLNEVIREE